MFLRWRATDVMTSCSSLYASALYRDLVGRQAEWADAGILSVQAIGDACAPASMRDGQDKLLFRYRKF